MKSTHYLLEVHGIHPSLAKRIYRGSNDTWIIEVKTPRTGICPACGQRSRYPKERGVDLFQGQGSRIHQVRLHVPWVRFYCRKASCAQSSFRFRVADGLGHRGGVTWPVAETVLHLAYEENQNNLDIKSLLWTLYGVEISEPTLRRILDDHQVRTPQDYAPVHLGIDEHFPKGQSKRKKRKQRSRLMLLDLDLGVVIAQVHGVDKEAARRLINKARKRCDLSRVKSVTRDLCVTWDSVLYAELNRPSFRVEIRVDRFHLVRNVINELYTKIYAPLRMSLREDQRFKEARMLFLNRFRFRKRRDRLVEDDERLGTVKVKKLDTMLNRFPEIADLYQLKEDFFKLMDLEPHEEELIDKRFEQILRKAIALNLHGLVDRLIRHREVIENNIKSVPTHMLPEQCFVALRAAERRRKSFRTDRSRERYCRARLRSAIRARRRAV